MLWSYERVLLTSILLGARDTLGHFEATMHAVLHDEGVKFVVDFNGWRDYLLKKCLNILVRCILLD